MRSLSRRMNQVTGAARTIRDLRRMPADLLLRQATLHQLRLNREVLASCYWDYVTHVSIPKMAISLELAAFLLTACQLIEPRAILDLGSGFSSYVFRHYSQAHANECLVVSVDDSQDWLEATQNYVARHKLSRDRFMTWNEFQNGAWKDFDLILHDLDGIKTRSNNLMKVVDLLARNGVIVLDDAHKQPYRSEALRILKGRGLVIYNLKGLTRDGFGRYSLMASRPQNVVEPWGDLG